MIAGVPYDAEVEYLESTGTQYIDTGIKPAVGDVVGCSFLLGNTPKSNYAVLFGCSWMTDGVLPAVWVKSTLKLYAVYCGGSFEGSTNAYVAGDILNITTTLGSSNLQTVINSDQITKSKGSADFPNITYHLFCTTKADGSAPYYAATSGTRCYSFSIQKNNAKILDLIPVRVGQVGYMYDRVTRKLFGNQGEGSFVLGPDVATPVMGLRRYAPTPTVYDCTMDGLVAMWDGICNVSGKEHEATPSMWKDLTGNGHDFIAAPGDTLSFSENAFVADGTKSLVATLPNEVALSEGTVEVVFHMPHRQGRVVYETLMCLSSGGFSIAAPTDSTEVGARGLSIKGGSRASAFSTLHVQQPTSYALLFDLAGVGETYCNGQYLGTFTPTVGFQSTTPGLIPLSYLNATFAGSIYAVRVYSRHLSAAEIEHNHEIDRKRFNLPA